MKQFLKEWGLFTLGMTLLVLSYIFVWSNVRVDGHSMDPTLAHDERLVIIKTTSIERFDIVVAKNSDGKDVVKRVVGMPGDTLVFDNDKLTINGQAVEETYLNEYQTAFNQDKLQATYSYNSWFQELARNAAAFTIDANGSASFTVTVPDGQYYLLGDDRLVSKDSRHVGTFSQDSLVGEVKFRFWPLSDFGAVSTD